ncbi:MAG: ABC transporter ATP-binding protein [Candidatus Carbobacillus sp.]|nr:ABC transporter ATP-binding protein [Candidatus Carbobacillus sp.]
MSDAQSNARSGLSPDANRSEHQTDIQSDMQSDQLSDHRAAAQKDVWPIVVRDLTQIFDSPAGRVTLFENVSWIVPPGTLVMLRGKSGTGKTTLLNILSGLSSPTHGEVRYGEMNLLKLNDKQRTLFRRRAMGIVFQAHPLVPTMTAYENIILTLKLAQVPRKEWDARVRSVLAMVEMERRAHHLPTELSGGEEQRIALARALVHHPSYLFADEPTAELDHTRSIRFMERLRQFQARHGSTIIMTTHDPELLTFADQIYELGQASLRLSVPT